MAVNWADLAVMTVLVAAGFAMLYAGLGRALRAAQAERQLALEHQLGDLAAALKALEVKVAELSPIAEPLAAIAPEFTMTAAEVAPSPEPAILDETFNAAEEEITPETMQVIAAAVTAFLGKKVRILSARRLQSPHPGMSPWSQQGRVFVQASHNLRMS
jgi:hypothetical protein